MVRVGIIVDLNCVLAAFVCCKNENTINGFCVSRVCSAAFANPILAARDRVETNPETHLTLTGQKALAGKLSIKATNCHFVVLAMVLLMRCACVRACVCVCVCVSFSLFLHVEIKTYPCACEHQQSNTHILDLGDHLVVAHGEEDVLQHRLFVLLEHVVQLVQVVRLVAQQHRALKPAPTQRAHHGNTQIAERNSQPRTKRRVTREMERFQSAWAQLCPGKTFCTVCAQLIAVTQVQKHRVASLTRSLCPSQLGTRLARVGRDHEQNQSQLDRLTQHFQLILLK